MPFDLGCDGRCFAPQGAMAVAAPAAHAEDGSVNELVVTANRRGRRTSRTSRWP